MALRTTSRIPAVLACALLASASLAFAGPDEAGGGAGRFRNADMGVSARTPEGWSMVADTVRAPITWQRLVTFNDKATDAQAVFSARPRTSTTLDDLLARVRQDWDATSGQLNVSSLRKIDATPGAPVGTVVVDASFVRKPAAPKVKPGEVPPPPASAVTMRVQATYFLAPGYEFLLYAQGQQTHWSRLTAPLSALRTSIQFDRKEPTGPQGAGSYRDDANGFSCRFPVDYTVVNPQRGNHIVQFEGIPADAPVLGVYAFRWDDGIEKDADRLIAYYRDEQGGEASLKRMEVAGRDAILVTASANVGGESRTFMLAIVKRGAECFRLRASMPRGSEAKGERVFREFADGFRFSAAK